MHDRTAHILEAVIQEFIDMGEPVSSGLLYERHHFGIKPAMIRLELDSLEEAGYLVKPHYSAGRVPTDRGYEFFANLLLEAQVAAARERRYRELLEEHAWGDLLNEISAQIGALSVALDAVRAEVHKAGLEQLIDRLDWEDREGIRSVIRDFEAMDERIPRAVETMGEGPNVFIGKKSPVTKSENLSVVGGNYHTGDTAVSIFVIGPKRMDYKKVIRIFKNL